MTPPRVPVAARRPRRFKALLLDALGTTVELEAPAPVLARLLAERHDVEVSDAEALAAFAAEMAHYRRRMGQACDLQRVGALRAECAEVLREALPPSPLLRAIDRPAMLALLLDSLRFRLYPDARAAIVAAREHGLRVVIASNWDAMLACVLDALGLSPLIDDVVTSAQVGAPKPSAVLFRAALRSAGAASHEALHVGDSFEEDVLGARGAGIEAILLRRDRAPAPPGCTAIDSLDELARCW